MLQTVKHVPVKIRTFAVNAVMGFLVQRIPPVNIVQTIVLWAHCVVNITVLASAVVTITGQEISVLYRVLQAVERAISLTSHLVRCAKKNLTVTAVKIHAARDV